MNFSLTEAALAAVVAFATSIVGGLSGYGVGLVLPVVIAPIVDLQLPIVGAVIRGRSATVELAKVLNPKVILPTAAGGDIEMSGILPGLLKAEGSAAELQSRLAAAKLSAQVIEPKPGDRLEVPIA